MIAPILAFSVEMHPSKYTYHKIPIYRMDLFGGTVWGFDWKSKIYLADSLDSARCLIRHLEKGLPEHIQKICAKLHTNIIGYSWEDLDDS